MGTRRKSPTKWMVLPIPKTPLKITANYVYKLIDNQSKQERKPKQLETKITHRSIDDDWTPSW